MSGETILVCTDHLSQKNASCGAISYFFISTKHKSLSDGLLATSGLLPIALHVDGAEFYANSEYLVWPMASIFGEGHVWDVKFPCVCIPHLLLQDFKDDVHEKVADILAWSLRCAAQGKWPSHGPFGEALTGTRAEWSEQVLAGGRRAAYFGFRYDGKARKEANRFQRSYQHNLVCECCLAQKTRPSSEPLLSYKNFYPDAAHTMTSIRKALSCCLVRTHTLKHD